MKNFIERLKICWNVLTKRNYVYFGLGKDAFLWDKNGYYIGTKKGKFAEFDYIEPVPFNGNTGVTSLSKVVWSAIKDYADTRESKINIKVEE